MWRMLVELVGAGSRRDVRGEVKTDGEDGEAQVSARMVGTKRRGAR